MRCTAAEGRQVHRHQNITQSMSNEEEFYVVMCQVNMMFVWMWMPSFSPSVHPHQQHITSTQNQHTLSILCQNQKGFYEN